MKQLPMGVQALYNFAKNNEKLNAEEMDHLRGGSGTNGETGSDGGGEDDKGGSW